MPQIHDWNKLKIFYIVAEVKSFSAAAEHFSISQSSVSRHISSLEDHIKSPLFHRHHKGLTLTEQGELLYETAKHIFKKINETEEILLTGRTAPRGKLKITTTHSFGSLWLSPIMPDFIQKYPDIHADLILDDRPIDLSKREADIAIRMWEPSVPDLISKPFIKIKYHYYASEKYLSERGEPINAEALDNHDLIAYSTAVPKLRTGSNMHLSLGYDSKKRKNRSAFYSANNLRSVFHATQAGLGISSLPNYMTHKVKHLKRILTQYPNKEYQTYIVYPYEIRKTKKVEVFIQFITEAARKWGFRKE